MDEEPWFNFVLPNEEPRRWRERRRWRRRHERIFRLEQELGIIPWSWHEGSVFPWVYDDTIDLFF